MNLPEKELKFKFEGEDYTAKFPKTGQHIEIATYRSALSGSQYENIASTRDIESMYVKSMIDVSAYITIMCPDLVEKLNVKSLMDLEAVDMRKLIDVYLSKIAPWYNNWVIALNKPLPKPKAEGEDKK